MTKETENKQNKEDNDSNEIDYRFSKSQMDNYNVDGYLVVKNHYNISAIREIADIANELKNIGFNLAENTQDYQIHILSDTHTDVIYEGTQIVIQRLGSSTSIARVVWAGASRPKLLEYGGDPKLTIPVAQILENTRADHLINQINYKLPGDKVKFGVHQDMQNRRFFDPEWNDINGKGSYVVAITAIDKVTIENGPLYVVPGSHTKGELDFPRLCDISQLPANINISGAVPLLMEPGDTVYMNPYVIHYSLENESPYERKVFINGFAYPGANHKQYPGIGSGKRVSLLPEDYLNLFKQVTSNDFDILTFKDEENMAINEQSDDLDQQNHDHEIPMALVMSLNGEATVNDSAII